MQLKPLRSLIATTGLADLVANRFVSLRGPASVSSVLTPVTGFGSNPGSLLAWAFVPPGLAAGAPLVVVLHGCTQDAASYDQGAGWSTLAARHGFAVLYAEQTRPNNPTNCFNWFQPANTARLGGEAESIAQMTAHLVRLHRLNPARVGVTGLSAGGAMTATMLATYPDVFQAGAIIAGIPYGAAATTPEAFQAMAGRVTHAAAAWGDLVRRAGPGRTWPTVQIWQGTADTTVRPAVADELVKQWTDVHGLPATPTLRDNVDGATHEAWSRGGRTLVERFTVPGLQHGTPLQTGAPDADRAVGHAGPHMLDAGISSTWHIARSWGLLTQASRAATYRSDPSPPGAPAASLAGVLRRAGLLRT